MITWLINIWLKLTHPKTGSKRNYERLTRKLHNYRKAIRDQQKATLYWKGRALSAELKHLETIPKSGLKVAK